MSFLVGSILFVALVGALDARLPWPRPVRKEGSR
jgi:hypothetical protein